MGGAATGQATLSDEELADGWILLFDGETLFGWKQASKANWKVADGVISVSEGEQGLLHTTSQFADYRLKVDFRSAQRTNSGIFLRTSPAPADVTGKCYELNIAGADNPFPTGSFVQRQKAEGEHQSTDWQTYDVTAQGGHFTVKLDGKLVLDYTDPKPLGRGFIGLQLNSGKVEFRNVKLKPLGLASIFNGKDLTGWKTYPEMESEFTVTKEGWMNVRNGKGQIETEGTYADFTMQLDVFVDGKALNSGVFFRCIPGEVMNGYESQIHNGYIDGDRTKPQDCGTGGIFRRQNARRVVADDFAWFQKTIHVDGKHVAVWVNGYQVTDFTDDRKPDANPRKGLRLEPGTIQIQGHDPTTNLSFRNLRIAEMPAR
ncbi:MAG: DUF1080 domain-containing protein [Candidatus Nealsonbacteria bacterium]|nr:DUF1080 domain-containing protein [Candidatus Nealsonbacteria bacterium]